MMTEHDDQRAVAPLSDSTNPQLPLHSKLRVQTLFLVSIVGAAAFLAGVWFATMTDSPHNDEEFQVFWQGWDILERDYYYELPEDQQMVYGALQGLLSTTQDPYTFFVPPVVAEFDRQTIAGEFGGIGAYVSRTQNGQLVISAPFKGLPAEQAGLQPGDIIEQVDDIPIRGWLFEDMVNLLRGEIGTQVVLTVFRANNGTRFTVEITRARVELPTADSRMLDDVGYVRLFSFNYRARAGLEDAMQELWAQEPRALILDLRGNPGGLLEQAVGVSDLFLSDGVILTQRGRNGDVVEYRSSTGDIGESIPLVVLVDSGSASASEVVAGALRDRDRAVLVGQTTYGKGSVQHVHDLEDGSQLHVTTALWFTPKEIPIQGQGLEPDVVVADDAEFDGDLDPYIFAAQDYIEQKFRSHD